MKDLLLITYHKIILLLLFVVLPCTTFGQEEVYILDDKIKGRAYYDFNEGNGEMTGAFYFESFKQDTLDPSLYYKYSLKGNYEKGLKQGTWRYDYKELSPIGDLHIDSIGFKESAEGQQRSIIGNFEQGEMNGKWTVLETSIDFSRIVDTFLHYDFSFSKDKLTGSFAIENDKNTIEGNVDEKGFIDGKLTFQYTLFGNEFVDERTFDHGRLIESQLMVNGEEVQRAFVGLSFPAKDEEDYVTLQMNEEYLNAIQLSQELDGNSKPLLESKLIILESDALFYEGIRSTKHHEDLSLWPESPELNFPLIKVLPSQKSDQHTALIDTLGENFNRLRKRINSVLTDEQVEIIANVNTSVSRYKTIYEGLDANYKSLYQPVVDALQQPGSKYLNTNVLIEHTLEGRSASSSFELENSQETIQVPFDSATNEKDQIEKLNRKVSVLLEFMDSIDATVNDVISIEKKRLSLTDEEKVMVDLRDSVHSLFNKATKNEYLQRISGKVIEQTDEEFSAYAKLELNDKIDKLDELNTCFKSFIELYKVIDGLPKEQKEIDSLYTRTVWNPFTYTDMDEIVKEKMYNAYSKVLFPHLMSEIEKQISCASIEQILHDIPEVIERMQQLRNEDTKDIEKALRRENDPLVIKETLNMDIQLF